MLDRIGFKVADHPLGGSDNGAPALRSMHDPACYGAFVRDPHGHNLQAVCHAPA